MQERLTIAVFYGGRAAEHDVSIISALQAMEALPTDRYDVVPVYITRQGHFVTGPMLRDKTFYQNFEERFVKRCYIDTTPGVNELYAIDPPRFLIFGGGRRPIAQIDCALLVLHGMNGEDGTLQGLLELADIPYTSAGVLGSSACMDKIAMKALFRGCGFPVCDWAWFDRLEWEKNEALTLARVEQEIGYPCYVKPANLGSSIGISRADDRIQLREAIVTAAHFDRRILVEKAVDKPMEINCSVLGWQGGCEASVCEQPLGWQEFLTFEDKYMRQGGGKSQGMKSQDRRIPAPIGREMAEEIQRTSCAIFQVMDLKGVVRIDYMIDASGKLYVGEVNTIPGSLAFYLWEFGGLAYQQLLEKMIEYALLAQAERRKSVFAYDSGILNKVIAGTKSGLKSGTKSGGLSGAKS